MSPGEEGKASPGGKPEQAFEEEEREDDDTESLPSHLP
jgi:hypothetical protein